jgi:hypothetical protein
MPLDAQLLARVLATPESMDVIETPVVRAVVLSDPANAADLVPWLAEVNNLQSRNARRVLCLFDAKAAAPILGALAAADTRARNQVIDVLWAILVNENAWTIRETLEAVKSDLNVLLDDRTVPPDEMPEYVERDFHGRVCDRAYLVLQRLVGPKRDLSVFRASDDEERNREIDRMKSRGFGLQVA